MTFFFQISTKFKYKSDLLVSLKSIMETQTSYQSVDHPSYSVKYLRTVTHYRQFFPCRMSHCFKTLYLNNNNASLVHFTWESSSSAWIK